MRKLIIIALAALGIAAVAALAADRSGEVSTSTTYKWQGKGLNGAVAVSNGGADPCADPSQCDFTVLHVIEPGQLTVHIVGDATGGPQDQVTDLDLYTYESDASGKQGKELKSSTSATADESVTVALLQPGYVLVKVAPAVAFNATFKGQATLGPVPPDPPTIDFGDDPAPSGGGSGDGGHQTPTTADPYGTDLAPTTRVTRPSGRRIKRLAGTAADADGKVAYVDLALIKRTSKGCKGLTVTGKFRTLDSCKSPSFIRAKGTRKWHLSLLHVLPKGSYTFYGRATDDLGRPDSGFGAANRKSFSVR
jgi:hypothetical protein